MLWLEQLRAAGKERFDALGFPTTKQEAWRFTSVAPIANTKFEARKPAFSLSTPGTRGVRVESLAHAIATTPDLVREHLGKYAAFQDQPFAALNTASITDGAFVYVPAKVVLEQPIELVFLAGPANGVPVVTHPRTLVVVEREARATIVETYEGGDGAYWTNAVTEIAAADGARVDCYRVQRESAKAYHVAVTNSHQGRDSTVRLHSVAFGAALARHDLRGTLAGPGGSLVMNGLYLLNGTQHADHHTAIDHAAPHCESHEYFNGVLDDASRGVFNGKIIVRPGAQKTDSKQTNNNLLLSDRAHADSQPQLEIYADDVKCTHGSTVGPLDPKALFYLESRGIGEAEARRLMTYGFAAEILNRMDIAPLREQLDGIVRGRLAES